jgi:RimJ/RimL family protein N-acetyltransferase/GNAT superfamily N-acetyltransferase
MEVVPVTLEGSHVRLEPLSLAHLDDLAAVGLDPELWRWIPFRIATREELAAYIKDALAAQAAGTALPFATVDRATSKAIGSTRYMNIDKAHFRVEIGSTWIARDFQRSAVNTEAKLLMLRHAFETLGCMRVELKTDSLNRRSRNAIQRIGARQEGIFRNHMVTSTGRIRHSVYFSIVDSEWPRVAAELESKLKRAAEKSDAPRRVDTLSESQIEDLHRLYQNEWWTKGRTLDDVRRMLDGTSVTIGFAEPHSGRLIAFARAVTDGTYKALVLDVIVDASARKTGLGKALMDAITSHPALASVQHFELYCRAELAPFYRRWGFEETSGDLRFLRKSR